jgi:5-methylcytosine-specific restriction enzyme A
MDQNNWVEMADTEHIRRERAKAFELKKGSWWKQRLGEGVCYHCGQRRPRAELTMDHVIPISRGGLSTKKNVVVACLECNQTKKHYTTAELTMMGVDLNSSSQAE